MCVCVYSCKTVYSNKLKIGFAPINGDAEERVSMDSARVDYNTVALIVTPCYHTDL